MQEQNHTWFFTELLVKDWTSFSALPLLTENPFINYTQFAVISSIARLSRLTSKKLRFLGGGLNPVFKYTKRLRVSAIKKLAMFYIRFMYKSVKFLKVFRWRPHNTQTFFSANFNRLKRKTPVRYFSWRFIKLKNKYMIRRMSTSSILRDVKYRLIDGGVGVNLRKSIRTRKKGKSVRRKSTAVLYLVLSFALTNSFQGSIFNTNMVGDEGSVNRVAIFALGSRVINQYFTNAISLSVVKVRQYNFGFTV